MSKNKMKLLQSILKYCQATSGKSRPNFTHHVVYIDAKTKDKNDFGVVIDFSSFGRLKATTKYLKFSEQKNRADADLQIVERRVANKSRLVVQQIVPAPISRISKTVLLYSVAWRRGPETICFNPRPAELWPDGILTSLISVAYPELSLQDKGQKSEQPYFAGARLIFAPRQGIIRVFSAINDEDFEEKDAGLVNVTWIKQEGDFVFAKSPDEQVAIGYIVAGSTSYQELVRYLEKTANRLSQKVFVSEYIDGSLE